VNSFPSPLIPKTFAFQIIIRRPQDVTHIVCLLCSTGRY